MNHFQSLTEYERFVYTLQQRYPAIRRSTLTVIRRGAAVARLTGELEIGDYCIVVREKLSFVSGPGQIISYGYEVWRGDEGCIGTILNPIPMTPRWPPPPPITSTCLPTSSTTASPRPNSPSPAPTRVD
ncbi:MAG TPA: hypothetical protein EYP49_17500 [Anaerolineae bacterium]|nr:hypothetical protein [Anaerolineae bacterium]